MQYDKNKNVSLLSDPIPIKYLPGRKNILHSLIDTSIKEGDCYDKWKYFAFNCENGSSNIQGIDFDHSYSPVEDSDSFRTNISIADMHRFTAKILNVINAFQNKNIPIY